MVRGDTNQGGAQPINDGDKPGFVQGLKDGVTETINGIIHPVESIKGKLQDIKAHPFHNGLSFLTMGLYGEARSFVNDASNKGVSYAIGKKITTKATEAAIVLATAGVVKAGFNVIKPKSISVYRVYGGDAKAEGFSWTPKDPSKVSNFRDKAGLPSGGESGATNTGRFVIEGTVEPQNIITQRAALPLDGNSGGLPEFIINPGRVTIKKVSGANPAF